MKSIPGIASDCYDCVINQARSAAQFAGLSDEQTGRVINIAEAGLEMSKRAPILTQHVIRSVADAVSQERKLSPDFDIYAKVKEESNVLSMAFYDDFQKRIASSDTPLETALQIAAAGNIMDFGANNQSPINLREELLSFKSTSFSRYDLEPFIQSLKASTSLLYVCDNCGEIVFDMLLMEVIKHEYPELQIVAALREKPILNDATLEDARVVGLDPLVTILSSGSVYPGTILAETTAEFQHLFASAGVVLSKGQGNFETLLPVSDNRIFFLLRIKCEYMAGLAKVRKDSLVLMHG